MNTDNMTISGETIDYGPCAFMDAFDPATVYSSIDTGGRYAYGNQPVVAEWNLARLAEALLPLFDDDQEQAVALAVESLGAFGRQYSAAWSAGMRAKLGLPDGPRRRGGAAAGGRAARPAAGRPRRLHVVLPRSRRGRPRRRRAGPRPVPRPRGVRRLGGALARARVRTPTRWTGSTRSTSRATTSSRRPGAATAGDLEPLGRLLDAVLSPTPNARPAATTLPVWPDRPYWMFCGNLSRRRSRGHAGLRPSSTAMARPGVRPPRRGRCSAPFPGGSQTAQQGSLCPHPRSGVPSAPGSADDRGMRSSSLAATLAVLTAGLTAGAVLHRRAIRPGPATATAPATASAPVVSSAVPDSHGAAAPLRSPLKSWSCRRPRCRRPRRAVVTAVAGQSRPSSLRRPGHDRGRRHRRRSTRRRPPPADRRCGPR